MEHGRSRVRFLRKYRERTSPTPAEQQQRDGRMPHLLPYTAVKSRAEIVSSVFSRWNRRSAEIRPKESWSQLAVKDMDSTSVATVMKKAGWNTGQYGIPTAIKITFDRSPFAGSEEIDVVAGFSDSAGETAKGILLGAHKDVISSVPARGTSLLEYFMTLRNNLKALPDGKLKRLLLVIHDEHSKVLFTWIYLKTGTEKNA